MFSLKLYALIFYSLAWCSYEVANISSQQRATCFSFVIQVEAEVSRLEELKTSKMKELVLKKRSELEEICRKTHMIAESDTALDIAIEAIESGKETLFL